MIIVFFSLCRLDRPRQTLCSRTDWRSAAARSNPRPNTWPRPSHAPCTLDLWPLTSDINTEPLKHWLHSSLSYLDVFCGCILSCIRSITWSSYTQCFVLNVRNFQSDIINVKWCFKCQQIYMLFVLFEWKMK